MEKLPKTLEQLCFNENPCITKDVFTKYLYFTKLQVIHLKLLNLDLDKDKDVHEAFIRLLLANKMTLTELDLSGNQISADLCDKIC